MEMVFFSIVEAQLGVGREDKDYRYDHIISTSSRDLHASRMWTYSIERSRLNKWLDDCEHMVSVDPDKSVRQLLHHCIFRIPVIFQNLLVGGLYQPA